MSSKNVYNVVYLPQVSDFNRIKKDHKYLKKECTYDLWEEFMEYVQDEICNSRAGVDLALYMGWMFIGAFPSKDNIFKDKRAYALAFNGIDHFKIQERDGFESRVLHTTTKSKKRAKAPTFFGFKPHASFKKKATAAFVNDWKKYVVIPNTRYMDGFMRRITGRTILHEKALKTHNEFED